MIQPNMTAAAHTPAEHAQHAADVAASLSRHGFAFLQPTQLVASQQQQLLLLTALQAEAAALQEQLEATALHSTCNSTSSVNSGCVLQVLPDLPHDAAACPQRYWGMHRRAWPCQPAVAAWLQSAMIRQLLGHAFQQQQPLLYNEQYIIKPPASRDSRSHSSDATAFAWHHDAQYVCAGGRRVQLLPRGESDAVKAQQPCFSACSLALWVALDATTPDNGALVLLPGHRAHAELCCNSSSSSSGGSGGSNACTATAGSSPLSQLRDGGELTAMPPPPSPPACTQQPVTYVAVESTQQLLQHLDARACRQPACGGGMHAAPLGLLMPAGAAVLFCDDVWHASGPNASMHERRAYMAQFSVATVAWADTKQLVALAVPLAAGSCAASASGTG